MKNLHLPLVVYKIIFILFEFFYNEAWLALK